MTGAPDPPDALDPHRVGTYPARAAAGGGYVWDDVLEYRVWSTGADGQDGFTAFATYGDAIAASRATPGAEEPLALVLQREFIDEPDPGRYRHVREERVTEWPVALLSRPRRDDRTIPDFLEPGPGHHRLDVLRGEVPRPT